MRGNLSYLAKLYDLFIEIKHCEKMASMYSSPLPDKIVVLLKVNKKKSAKFLG